MHSTKVSNPAGLDPLLHGHRLPLRGLFHPLGFPLEIATNSAEVLRAADESWGPFPAVFTEPPLRLQVAVSEECPASFPGPPVYRARHHLLAIVSDAAHFASCDLAAGFSFCWMTPGAVQDRDWFRFHYLEAAVYVMLVQLHVTSVHAACVARRGAAVLLSGGPASGKSCLAYAAARRGWAYLSDDVSSLVRASQDPVVLGKPHQIRFRESAARLFPELAGRLARLRPNGKVSIELRTAELEGIEQAFQARAEHVVFLKRLPDGPARFSRLDSHESLCRLLDGIPRFEDRIRKEHEDSLRRLLAAQAWELSYSSLDSAVEQLDKLVG